jgi:hypothetical protein
MQNVYECALLVPRCTLHSMLINFPWAHLVLSSPRIIGSGVNVLKASYIEAETIVDA